MNRFILAIALCALASPAFAADPAPSPTKPPTVAELQQQVAYWKAATQAAVQQRDQAQAALANEQIDVYAKQASAPQPQGKPTP